MAQYKSWQQDHRIYSAAKFDHYFPALWLLAALLKMLAWLAIPIGLGTVISLRPSGIAMTDLPVPLFLLTILASAVVGFLLWAASDFLMLLLCLECNTDPRSQTSPGP